MKILRFRIGKEVKPGLLDQEGNIRDASSLVNDWDNKNLTFKYHHLQSSNFTFIDKDFEDKTKIFNNFKI